ncbi:hypothetical protein SS1G_07091 [Sclerotinia sclerotiorum 1980 UF-70]|uniref:Zn(2)-C6 fungal-type domain-containing protein n=1 Tax=Sclerotinia sclerotiorum (strain ATCC 18683 / 1980 / Ss-1) TaxID=665079 RepID=A7EP42_SCLS1|nr:hypothetical protein SS1G_07091 [Sclerotinia sclerotiorum 1980 UF-70]EDO04608.1 hypothetical protein SS1G_07091 [Sclerotinia sclerotiorum 1980 UF-70]
MDELPAQVSGVSTHDVRNTISKKFPRQAACLNCRRSKTRCIRGPADVNCQRCRQNDMECLVPDFHVGRRKGVKNKRSGLDKVVHQLEKAIKSSKNHNVPKEEDHVALDDAENPLQLLARASDLADTAAKQRCMPTSLSKTGELPASALFIPLGAALSKRLSNHRKYLVKHVMSKRFRSPEIVLAFMINIPWMSPENHWAEDETCSYMALAHSVALDISLNKIIILNANSLQTAVLKSDCISARKALDMDGFVDVDPTTRWGQKLLRRRERIWLALFNLDRGTRESLYRTASSVLRRDIAKIITSIKDTCDSTASTGLEGYDIAQTLRQRVDDFFNHWYSTWTTEIGQDKDLRLPPYVEILVSHTRLAIYSNVLNYPGQTSAISHFFRSAGLSSALNVMRAAVQGEPLLKSMPNNTAIMVSFSACFALYLSTTSTKNNPCLRESIKVLIEETATVLERIGNITPHRKGSSALYGMHLQEILRNSLALRRPVPYDPSVLNGGQAVSNTAQETQERGLEPGFFEPLQLSAMSVDQIVEFFENEEATLGISPTNLQLGDTTGMEWLDWFDFYETAEG